jgi:hypothetical protein
MPLLRRQVVNGCLWNGDFFDQNEQNKIFLKNNFFRQPFVIPCRNVC